MNSPISDEPAQMQPRSKTPAEKTESSGWTWLLNPAGLSLPVYSQPATSLLVKAADPQTETEGLRPGFSPTHHPYIFVDCIKIQLEKQWDNCNCILIQRWGGDRSRGYYRLRDLSLMWNTPATITLSRTEINTKHTYDCMHSAIWWSCMLSTRYQSIGFLW